MLQEAAVIALGVVLAAASWQDVRTREIDAWIFAVGALPAAALIYMNFPYPFYLFSLAVSLVLASVMRFLGSGYADSIAMALIGSAPPVPPFPTAFIVILAGSVLLPVHMVHVYLANRGKPCEMTSLEKLTHICISKEEFHKNPTKYIVGEVRDVEKYDPRRLEVREQWIKAKYGLPYLLYLTVGYWIYVILYLSGKSPVAGIA
ncbi:prepilin peptidase [Pyrobaculum aerophilum]|uniref:prepilin peptidase n=1 Tax=Pyrobaculum aerophilum TaxID=13773 RepID=UPI0023EFCB4B|nr:prepilin peptidase [Pyrobaculum aerophilum]MCX8136492.1 prepilin peptidase [Pyrobaculum aerophilum]